MNGEVTTPSGEVRGGPAMITISGLSKVYQSNEGDVVALEGLDLAVAERDIFGIIGLSGAGKSTLIRCINLLERPTTGTIEIDGKEITRLEGAGLRELRSSLGMIFQHFNLLMQKTVWQNVMFPLEIAGAGKKEARSRAAELLDLVGLSEKANAYPSQLSGGQKQRVAIARALANRPKVLLCDEATSALDPLTTMAILALLKRINTEFGLTILIITHEMTVIREICNRVAVMDKSRIVETGPVAQVIAGAKTEPARMLLGCPAYGSPGAPPDSAQGPLGRSVLRVYVVFADDPALREAVSATARRFGLENDVFHRNADGGSLPGELVVRLSGAENGINSALSYFTELGMDHRVLTE